MIIKDTTYNKYVRSASSIVLTEQIPHNWNELDWNTDLKHFIKKNRSVVYKNDIDEASLWLIILRIAMEMENAVRL